MKVSGKKVLALHRSKIGNIGVKDLKIGTWRYLNQKEVNKIFKIQEKIINLIYPQTCGICGKINNKTICSKCNIQLKKQE